MNNQHTPPSDGQQVYDGFRPRMFSIAYRMLGSVSEAEDVVQEAFLRLYRASLEGTPIESPQAFLTTITTRLAIDTLRTARVRREQYVGLWLPEPLMTASEPDPSEHAELADSLSFAFLSLLETLSPLERAVFLLREIFDYGYDEIAEIVQKSEQNCRQIFTRARKHLDGGKPRFTVSHEAQHELLTRFLDAAGAGSLDSLVELLATDAIFYGDGGGKVTAYPRPIFGNDRVARLLQSMFATARELGISFQFTLVNRQPGILSFDSSGRLVNVLVLDISGGVIQTLRSVANPDKLVHLGFPLSDVLTLDRAAKQPKQPKQQSKNGELI